MCIINYYYYYYYYYSLPYPVLEEGRIQVSIKPVAEGRGRFLPIHFVTEVKNITST